MLLFFPYLGLLICGVKGYLISGVTCFCLGTREILSETTLKSWCITTITYFFPFILLSVASAFQLKNQVLYQIFYLIAVGKKNRRIACLMKHWLYMSVSFPSISEQFTCPCLRSSVECVCFFFIERVSRDLVEIIQRPYPFAIQGHLDCFHIFITDNYFI